MKTALALLVSLSIGSTAFAANRTAKPILSEKKFFRVAGKVERMIGGSTDVTLPSNAPNARSRGRIYVSERLKPGVAAKVRAYVKSQGTTVTFLNGRANPDEVQ